MSNKIRHKIVLKKQLHDKTNIKCKTSGDICGVWFLIDVPEVHKFFCNISRFGKLLSLNSTFLN